MPHALDNPVWYALTGPQADLAVGHGLARHYPRDITPFSAIAEATAAAYADLAVDLPPGREGTPVPDTTRSDATGVGNPKQAADRSDGGGSDRAVPRRIGG